MPEELQISKILDEFNFTAVQAVMSMLKHYWNGREVAPTVQELRQASADLMSALLVYDSPVKVSSGGFVAEKYFTEDGAFIELNFVAVSLSGEWFMDEDV